MNLTFAGHRVNRLTKVAGFSDLSNVNVTSVQINVNFCDLASESECRGVTDVTTLLDTLTSRRCELSGSYERTVCGDVLLNNFDPVYVLSLLLIDRVELIILNAYFLTRQPMIAAATGKRS